jgi:hypothetical protein
MRAVSALLCLLVVACQKGPTVDKTYQRDIANLCDAERLSGALDSPEGGRAPMVAAWLGENIVTQEARDFLARLAGMPGTEKAAALRNEGRRVEIGHCALADTWAPAPN